MKKAILFLLLVLTGSPVFAVQISFPYNPRFRPSDYLVYLLRKIPLDQLRAEANSPIIHLNGVIELNTQQLPGEIRDRLKPMLKSALAGELPVSGATIDSSQAEIFYDVGTFLRINSQSMHGPVGKDKTSALVKMTLLGPPGMGKSTLLEMEMRERFPSFILSPIDDANPFLPEAPALYVGWEKIKLPQIKSTKECKDLLRNPLANKK